MKYTKEQLLRLRENTNRLLRKMEEDEKDRYQKVALSFQNSQARIDEILEKLAGDKSYEKLVVILQEIKGELGEAVKASVPDMKPVIEGLSRLNATVGGKKDFSDEGIVLVLGRLEKLLSGLNKPGKDRTDEIIKALGKIKVELPEIEFPKSVSIDNFPPQKIPQPVTNININPMDGLIHTTAQTLTTNLSAIPEYGVLDKRRAVLIYNNSSTTIYLGGSDVTSSNGMPVPASSYSPILDAGPRMIIYGLTASSTAAIRVMEISNTRGA